GSHACRMLRAGGFSPVAFDNLSTGHADAVSPLIRGDVRDRTALVDAMRAHKVDAVMHFAASAYVGESMVKPLDYYDNNVSGMISLLSACREAGVARVVFSSSCATYGIPDALPIRETTPQRPINPYGRTKLICEDMLRDFDAAYALAHVALRYFNAAGADPSGALAERHSPETHLIPLALRAASGQAGPLAIFGTDYDTPDGTCIRDYIHVDDLARAHVMALQYLLEGKPSVALNLGSGTGLSVRQILTAIEKRTGKPVPAHEHPRRPGDPPVLTADPTLAANVLGFRTRLSDIDTIIKHAAPWFGLEISHASAD
ncbi:MAG: UDP-glucose 4-epimerase GalE, partial [Paracoccaceae bacterium]|nr:UDP-glucose 4-epimerase GalE [Paracoccaceae bacterium]